jgi:hypothetical protein
MTVTIPGYPPLAFEAEASTKQQAKVDACACAWEDPQIGMQLINSRQYGEVDGRGLRLSELIGGSATMRYQC